MLGSYKRLIPVLSLTQKCLLQSEKSIDQQIRTTFILKRRFEPRLSKKGMPQKTLRSRNYIYDLVKHTSQDKNQSIEVILTSYVEGLGNPRDRVSVSSNYAYNKLLLPGLAVYASPENAEYENFDETRKEESHSSPTALVTVGILSRMTLSVVMNKEIPWTVQPWHIRTSLRKCGYIVPEEAITMPLTPITGPSLDLENKEFHVTITVNKTETADVKCRIHHWSTDISERLPYVYEFWKNPTETVFKDEKVLTT